MGQSFPIEPDEDVSLVVGRHWIALWPRFLAQLLLAGLPAGFVIGLLTREGLARGNTWRLVAAVAAVWIGFWLVRAALLKYRYDHERWLLTDRRLIGMAAPAPFRSSVTLIDLAEIQDVSVHRTGPASMLLGFGDVECRTGSAAPAVLRQARRPHDVARRLQQGSRDARRAGTRITARTNTRPL